MAWWWWNLGYVVLSYGAPTVSEGELLGLQASSGYSGLDFVSRRWCPGIPGVCRNTCRPHLAPQLPPRIGQSFLCLMFPRYLGDAVSIIPGYGPAARHGEWQLQSRTCKAHHIEEGRYSWWPIETEVLLMHDSSCAVSDWSYFVGNIWDTWALYAVFLCEFSAPSLFLSFYFRQLSICIISLSLGTASHLFHCWFLLSYSSILSKCYYLTVIFNMAPTSFGFSLYVYQERKTMQQKKPWVIPSFVQVSVMGK